MGLFASWGSVRLSRVSRRAAIRDEGHCALLQRFSGRFCAAAVSYHGFCPMNVTKQDELTKGTVHYLKRVYRNLILQRMYHYLSDTLLCF